MTFVINRNIIDIVSNLNYEEIRISSDKNEIIAMLIFMFIKKNNKKISIFIDKLSIENKSQNGIIKNNML